MDDGGAKLVEDLAPSFSLADLDIGELASPGRATRELHPTVVRPLNSADLALLASSRGIKPIAIKKLSERHHGLARLIASGMKNNEAAFAMGFDQARVSVLKDDPTFAELVEFYRGQVDSQFAAVFNQLTGFSKDLLIELRERLEDAPEKFDSAELANLLRLTLDRTGHGPSRTEKKSVVIDMSERMDRARQRALEARRAARADSIDAEIVGDSEDFG